LIACLFYGDNFLSLAFTKINHDLRAQSTHGTPNSFCFTAFATYDWTKFTLDSYLEISPVHQKISLFVLNYLHFVMNSRYRERKYNTSDNDRLLRALSQPVQAW
jgi:hypothetical protein